MGKTINRTNKMKIYFAAALVAAANAIEMRAYTQSNLATPGPDDIDDVDYDAFAVEFPGDLEFEPVEVDVVPENPNGDQAVQGFLEALTPSWLGGTSDDESLEFPTTTALRETSDDESDKDDAASDQAYGVHSSENIETNEAVAGDSAIEPQADGLAQIVDLPDLDLALDQAESTSDSEEFYAPVESDDDFELLTEPSILIDEVASKFLDFDDEDDDVNESEGGELASSEVSDLGAALDEDYPSPPHSVSDLDAEGASSDSVGDDLEDQENNGPIVPEEQG